MIRILIFCFLFLSFNSFSQINLNKIDKPFDINLQIDKVDTELYRISSTIELENGSYIISPFSEDDTYMHFGFFIDKSDNISEFGEIMETPISVEELDPILNQQVRLVREKTTYNKHIRVVNQKDFEISGVIEFLLEPVCKPYVIEYTIFQRSGKLEIKKMKTRYHESYKGK